MTLRKMNKNDSGEPPSRKIGEIRRDDDPMAHSKRHAPSFALTGWFKDLFSNKTEVTNLRDALEEYIVESEEHKEADPSSFQERELLGNILKLRNVTVVDVMVPRADIVAIDLDISQKDLLEKLAQEQFSRVPVYKDNLDNVIGTIHVKDILASLARGEKVDIPSLIKNIPVVSPALPVLDLILEMRAKRRHMALVVDEYGGIDGLVTVGDVVEFIVGDINDEHDQETPPEFAQQGDGTILADARVELDDFEEEFGKLFSEKEHEESDTLGGLVCDLVGRVPARGEILKHDSGIRFEILDADPRRLKRVRIHNVPRDDSDS